MKLPAMLLALIAVGSILLFGNCGLPSAATGPPPISITPHIASLPVNGSVTFTSVVPTGTNNPNWSVLDSAYADNGSPKSQTGGTTFTYTAPATPPIYTSTLTSTPNGDVIVQAVNGINLASVQFAIISPSIAVTLTPATATVALGATQNFHGYAVGGLNNNVIAQVNGVTGGSTTLGTFQYTGYSPGPYTYTYTAPATMPMSGSTITLSLVSQAQPSQSATATVTLH